MALYLITNQHRPDDCPELADELASYYETHDSAGARGVYCNCRAGEHRMFFLVDAAEAAQALNAIPEGFLRTATTATQVEEAYRFATGAS